ncbi:uncharacterized protein BO95DRAFT_444589 [Aspergillus brunneoviolaceus CBS 621.78]|uniref:Uncharacterized protein n=1 Tax=Aspergillus brunneoviolaceus CBS 621.78 TaxID=1450534 RepID=A0ACD1G445_9EURO|nr:hypothetical protein BO95DRAFT_444589 [Aspergillus brunneoviolaceus CBS 621.78]RAH44019.1 hypothetical protein BO95DRAFT_444589 [Aspergillus brunneoviolaceus CBS 621.78]
MFIKHITRVTDVLPPSQQTPNPHPVPFSPSRAPHRPCSKPGDPTRKPNAGVDRESFRQHRPSTTANS